MADKQQSVIVLVDLRSVLNAGAIFRTADAIGVNKIYLCGTTPAPIDRFGRTRKDFSKTALGSENSVAWEYEKNVALLIKRLKKDGFKIIAVEQSPKSVDYKKIKIGRKTAFVFGNEPKGLSPKILKLTDVIAEIPMRGKKESLNVAVAAGIALFRALDR